MPNAKTAYFVALHGQAACLPDYVSPPQEFTRRRDWIQWIDSELSLAGFSERSRRQVNLQSLWKWIQARGGTVAQCSFVINATDPSQRGQIIEFRAMTRDEFETMEKESEHA
jgi:hypothetical protein